MADDPLANAVETFSAPIESLIAAVGQGLAQAQYAMDTNSVKMQETIDADPVLSQYGLQATWYQFPKVDLQLTMSLSVAEDQTTDGSTGGGGAPVPTGPVTASSPALLSRIRLVGQPVSASFQSHFNYSGTAASQINLSIVPVPGPHPGDKVTLPPRMIDAPPQQLDAATLLINVRAAAYFAAPKFLTTKDPQTNAIIPAANDGKGNALRCDANFNSMSRTWYVLQYAPANKNVIPVVVAVDDATAAVRVISTP